MNHPMMQFEVIADMLTVVDMSRWDFYYGFRRVIGRLK